MFNRKMKQYAQAQGQFERESVRECLTTPKDQINSRLKINASLHNVKPGQKKYIYIYIYIPDRIIWIKKIDLIENKLHIIHTSHNIYPWHTTTLLLIIYHHYRSRVVATGVVCANTYVYQHHDDHYILNTRRLNVCANTIAYIWRLTLADTNLTITRVTTHNQRLHPSIYHSILYTHTHICCAHEYTTQSNIYTYLWLYIHSTRREVVMIK